MLVFQSELGKLGCRSIDRGSFDNHRIVHQSSNLMLSNSGSLVLVSPGVSCSPTPILDGLKVMALASLCIDVSVTNPSGDLRRTISMSMSVTSQECMTSSDHMSIDYAVTRIGVGFLQSVDLLFAFVQMYIHVDSYQLQNCGQRSSVIRVYRSRTMHKYCAYQTTYRKVCR